MHLNMYLDDVLIESMLIDLTPFKTTVQRQKYVQELAYKLIHQHKEKLVHTHLWPEFFIEGVPSKMNVQELV